MSTISLTKGSQPAVLTKSPSLRLRCWWDSRTDYDLYAIVLYTTGRVETVATFPAEGVPALQATADGAVKHLGDVGREHTGTAEETIEISPTDEIRAIVAVAYSAQSNGTGSFHKYRVSMELDNGLGERVVIDARNASRNRRIYTCAPGMIENTAEGLVVHALERYSAPGSENRPTVTLDVINNVVGLVMDTGPRNKFK